MNHLWVPFFGGLLAFPHCLGMCGGFVLHFAQDSGGKRTTLQLLWLTGKLVTYALLGAVAGYAGGTAQEFLRHAGFQDMVSWIAGLVILLMGLFLLGLIPVGQGESRKETMVAIFFRTLMASSSAGGALTFGLVTGFLPCPIVIAFLATAVHSGSVATGIGTMAAFGLGTIPPLLLLGAAGGVVFPHLRRWGARTGGGILVLLGLVTLLRGTSVGHHLLGCEQHPAPLRGAPLSVDSCCAPGSGTNGGR